MNACNSVATETLGIGVKMSRQTQTLHDCAVNRLGRCSTDLQLTSFVEFTVQKVSPRHNVRIRN